MRSARSPTSATLIAPDGTEYRIKTFEANGRPDIQATYGINASSGVADGSWRLRVQDTYPGNEGFLDSWKITF
ncbi:proprotein convertase P-domain-containing protein [Streptomyces sp. NPDC006798]|uniref:proprotein convertase P-domain-containing protein n=1 Tax=Streptomyces sp. NPDC006798 TaxID=3155462 RepID=UPI0033F699FB